MNDTLTAAQSWLDRGVAVVPVLPHSKRPAIKWKQFQSELPSIVDIVKWFYRPSYNLAIVTGWQNLTILDFDDIVAYAKFIYDYPQFRDTYTIESARGMHLYYYCDNPPKQSALGDNIDVKSTGYCLTYPSIHPSGKQYQVAVDKPIMRIQSLPHAPSIGVLALTGCMLLCYTPNTRCGDIVQRIKSDFSITLLFPHYTETGNGMALAHCPGKSHKNGDVHPSLSLDLKSNRANCFKSNCEFHSKRGNSNIDVWMILNNVSFKTAVREMAERLGL